MHPLTFVTGVVLGSALSITLITAVVALIMALVPGDNPRLDTEYDPLLQLISLFGLLTAFAAASFVGLLRHTTWRWWAQGAMWLTLLSVGAYYWPD